MNFAIIVVTALLLLGVVIAAWSRLSHDNGDAPVNMADSDCGTCNGDNDSCERECQLEAAVNGPEYFDDEELDRFQGRPSDGYTDDETEEFAYVLHTMADAEVAAWLRSLTLRGINLPDELKDEAIMRRDS